jgi:DNA (cytosine-5)-methyltransferase 1
MWDVPRFAEVHRYHASIVENVVDALRWEPFSAWLWRWMRWLPPPGGVPQLDARPGDQRPPPRRAATGCTSCSGVGQPCAEPRHPAAARGARPATHDVDAVQVFKPRGKTWPLAQWGRYRAQYVYRCPTPRCHVDVEPYALPAAAAIDWTTLGERIGDRDRPLSDKTLARIRAGLERYARPLTFEATGNTFVRPDSGYARAWPVDWPTATLTTSQTRALLVPAGGTRNDTAASVCDPFRTRLTRENEGLLVPVEGRDGLRAAPVAEPMRTQTARHETALVVPYYRTGRAQPAGEPMPTMCTVDTAGLAFIAELRGGGSTTRCVCNPLATVCASGNHHMLVRQNTPRGNPAQMCTSVTEPARTLTTAGHQSLVGWPAEPAVLEDCTFRMLTVPEIQAAMAFTPDYVVTGSKREQVRQLGNGVTPPAAEWLIRAVVESLSAGGRAA